MSQPPRFGFIEILQEYSIPLLSGVAVAMVAANFTPVWYQDAIHWRPFGDLQLFGHVLDLHFLVNDIFMVFFFGIAAKEITESCLPGGALNPPAKAMNPLFATLGGVVGPVCVFFLGLALLHEGVFAPQGYDWATAARGWGVPTATDIALAWLVAHAVFGEGHPAVNFLLLLAVADDAIGLVYAARRPDGRWGKGSQYSGEVFFTLEPGRVAGRWNTLRALRVLRWWEEGVADHQPDLGVQGAARNW